LDGCIGYFPSTKQKLDQYNNLGLEIASLDAVWRSNAKFLGFFPVLFLDLNPFPCQSYISQFLILPNSTRSNLLVIGACSVNKLTPFLSPNDSLITV
jgi:hypothetical protein